MAPEHRFWRESGGINRIIHGIVRDKIGECRRFLAGNAGNTVTRRIEIIELDPYHARGG
jgi:hypothetical protein